MTPRPFIPELLDTGNAAPEEIRRNLADLRRLNRWLGARRVLLKILAAEVRRAKLKTFSLLDVGAGSGDLPAAIARRFPAAFVVACDLKPLHLEEATTKAVAAAAEALPFRDGSFDFVSASQLLHQFRDPEVIRLLASFGRLARRAVLIHDLERHWFPLLFLRLTEPFFARSYLAKHDAPASVRQGFRPGELARLARTAGFSDISERRHWPWFRLSLLARRHA
ncbi:MAG: methyltransferase domain-containing protein [Acidobacteria bacterium]|nr:methyltransferase domain-containing protein [Acidobacteriota bacterium]